MVEVYSSGVFTTGIHPSAIVHPGAEIGEGTTIGPFSIIGPNVKLGKGNRLASHIVIDGHTEIGDENIFYPFASIGTAPQDLKFKGERSVLSIGNQNIIREYVTIQPGTQGGGMKTSIGDKNLFMANCHVGHDGVVGNGNIFANSSALAGHVTVGDRVTVGGLSGIHQFVRIGDFAILGAGSMVPKDIPPFCIAHGDRAHLVGINKIGLERGGMSSEEITKVQSLYKKLFFSAGPFADRVSSTSSEFQGFQPADKMLEFIKTSERGVTFPRRES